MSSRAWRLRAATLVSAGALVVHELRYAVAYRGGSSQALAEQGHSYLGLLTPLVVVLALLALGGALWRAARGRTSPAPRLSRLWPTLAGALAAIHFSQEWLEGLLASGHPSGVSGALTHGGPAALGFCVVVGGAAALALRRGAEPGELAPRAATRILRAHRGFAFLRQALAHELPDCLPVAFARSARGPPAVSA